MITTVGEWKIYLESKLSSTASIFESVVTEDSIFLLSEKSISDYETLSINKVLGSDHTLLMRYKQNYFAFADLNQSFRDGTPLSDSNKRMRNAIEMAMYNHTTVQEMQVFRIVDLEDYPEPTGHLTELGFMSTSCDLQYLVENLENYDSPLIIGISVPQGVEYVKFPNDFESEVLFERGLTLQYNSGITSMSDGYKYISAKITK